MGSCAAPSAKGDDKFITTDYLQQCPVTERRNEGLDVPPEFLPHISPLGWAHILLTGEYLWPKEPKA
ncbi:Tn3 family transposase [Klebsiella pneumoniae]|nr:Tn3 family transposase [Klebsiella pneumoniae]NON93323.1 Tn3 family transposase [Klebsiella pneumoniae]NOP08355.1 Tn3 family transposase [Klebsiella pneumoniae]NOP19276.1 Tn3 family transposase [Klebsiella pneumoniae]NOP35635.1 Tn3 family transposase [Klebsiella pneumoniae]